MGKKIDSIKEMYSLGLPAPGCVFIYKEDNIEDRINEYFSSFVESEFYTIRTDTNDSSMSCVRKLSATKEELIMLANEWINKYQVILQEFIDERLEVKSGNIYLLDDEIIIEGALLPHHIFTNGKLPDVHISIQRFDSYYYIHHRLFRSNFSFECFSESEIFRLIRLSRKIPYTKAIVEFSFFNNGKLYFWEIKKEK